MFNKIVWRFLANISGLDFEKEYNEARKLNVRGFLKNLLFHANNNVPYYNSILRKVGAVKDNKLYLSNFDKIPVLTKEIIRKQFSELISRDYEKRKWFYNSSSGSTGEPITFVQDRLFVKWINATSKYYYKDIIGIDENFAKKILLWGSERDIFKGNVGLRAKTINFLSKTVFLNSLRMTEADMERYIRVINSYKPEIIRGYAGSLYEICRFIEKREMSVHTPSIVVSSAETLRDDWRNKIECVFGTKVYDFYGSREVDGIAGECKYGLLHIFMFNNYVEVVDHKYQRVNEGENGKVVVTALHNYSMPFIRYEIGDTAILGAEKCKCGNPLPTLKKVTGRSRDHFIREDGTIIYGGFFTRLFWEIEWVEAVRVIQEDYKKIKIMIVLRNEIVSESEKRDIEEKIKFVMGKDCRVTWEVIDEIPRTEGGKYVHTQSLLAK